MVEHASKPWEPMPGWTAGSWLDYCRTRVRHSSSDEWRAYWKNEIAEATHWIALHPKRQPHLGRLGDVR